MIIQRAGNNADLIVHFFLQYIRKFQRYQRWRMLDTEQLLCHNNDPLFIFLLLSASIIREIQRLHKIPDILSVQHTLLLIRRRSIDLQLRFHHASKKAILIFTADMPDDILPKCIEI